MAGHEQQMMSLLAFHPFDHGLNLALVHRCHNAASYVHDCGLNPAHDHPLVLLTVLESQGAIKSRTEPAILLMRG